MLYTHNWALFFGAGSVLSLVVLYFISGDEIRENLIRDAIYAYVGAAILFAPWVANFIFQSLHTAAPWNTSPRFGAPIQIAQSVYGGATVAAILLIGAAVGYAGLFAKAERASTAGQGRPDAVHARVLHAHVRLDRIADHAGLEPAVLRADRRRRS